MTDTINRAGKVHLQKRNGLKIQPLTFCIISHSAFNFKSDNLRIFRQTFVKACFGLFNYAKTNRHGVVAIRSKTICKNLEKKIKRGENCQ